MMICAIKGSKQTAAIVDGILTLPVSSQVIDLGRGTEPWLLPYELEPVLEQLLRTTEMKINPYQAFAPIPAKVTINLNVDRWTQTETNWSSPETRRFSVTSSPGSKASKDRRRLCIHYHAHDAKCNGRNND